MLLAEAGLRPRSAAAREHIICVDDEEGILTALRQQLLRFEADFEIDLARSAEEALELIDDLEQEQEPVAVVIADQIMPGMKGAELLTEVHRRHPDAAKVLLTGQAGLDAVVQAINQAGLDRFIAKPWDEHDLWQTVANLLERVRLSRENKRLLEDLQQKNRELSDLNLKLEERVAGRTRQLALANERLAQLAITDGLTSLNNHRFFQERLAMEVERSNRNQLPLSLLMIDVDHFKQYNDRHGHPAGDAVLRQVAQLLAEGRRLNDTVARYGGEEFSLLLVDTPREAAAKLAEQLRTLVASTAFAHEETQPGGCLTISIGIATCPDDARHPDALLASADQALYRAKRAGRNRVELACAGPEPA